MDCSTIFRHKNKARRVLRSAKFLLSIIIFLSALISGISLVYANEMVVCNPPLGSDENPVTLFVKEIDISKAEERFPQYSCTEGGDPFLPFGIIASCLIFILARLYSLRGKNQGHVCACLGGCWCGRKISETVDDFIGGKGANFLLGFVHSVSWSVDGDFYEIKVSGAQRVFSVMLCGIVLYAPMIWCHKKILNCFFRCCCKNCCKTNSKKFIVTTFVWILVLVSFFAAYLSISSSWDTFTSLGVGGGSDGGDALLGVFGSFTLFNPAWGPLPSKVVLSIAGPSFEAVSGIESALGIRFVGERIRKRFNVNDDWNDEIDETKFQSGANTKPGDPASHV